MTPRKIQYWVIPPEANGEFVACMENVVVLENSNGYLTPLSAEVVPLFRSLLGSLHA